MTEILIFRLIANEASTKGWRTILYQTGDGATRVCDLEKLGKLYGIVDDKCHSRYALGHAILIRLSCFYGEDLGGEKCSRT